MIYIAKDISKNALVHYGTKNMKWGVRKYQNEDGTLTEAGKKRYRDKLPSSALEAMTNPNGKTYRRTVASREISPITVYDKNGNKLTDDYYNVLTGYGRQAIKPSNDINGTSMYGKGWKTNVLGYDGMPTSAREANYKETEKNIIKRAIAKNAAKYEGQIPTSARLGMQGKNVIQKVKAGKGSMPTSAITAQQRAKNESIVKSSIPASAWNSRASYINRGPKAKASGLSTFMKKSLGR